MVKTSSFAAALFLGLCVAIAAQNQTARTPAPGDWPEMRGPKRDGTSTETGLPNSWKLNGENFLWRAPYGGRSAPIVNGKRV